MPYTPYWHVGHGTAVLQDVRIPVGGPHTVGRALAGVHQGELVSVDEGVAAGERRAVDHAGGPAGADDAVDVEQSVSL